MSRFDEIFQGGARDVLLEQIGDDIEYCHSDGLRETVTAVVREVSEEELALLNLGLSTRTRSRRPLIVLVSSVDIDEPCERRDQIVWSGKTYAVARHLSSDGGMQKLYCE